MFVVRRIKFCRSLVWSDKHASFEGLGEVVGCAHETVDHDSGQFSRVRGQVPWRNFIKTKGNWRDLPRKTRLRLQGIGAKCFLKRRLSKKEQEFLQQHAKPPSNKKPQTDDGPTGVTISSNAAEGLIGRTKRLLRHTHTQCKDREYYALPLAEYVWKTKYLSNAFLKGSHGGAELSGSCCGRAAWCGTLMAFHAMRAGSGTRSSTSKTATSLARPR